MEMCTCDKIFVYLCSSCRRTTFSFPSFSVVVGKHSATVQHNREGQKERKESERMRGGERDRMRGREREERAQFRRFT